MGDLGSIPAHDCKRSVNFVQLFMAMTKEDRAARNLQALKDALYHVYWCSSSLCEGMWTSLMKDAGHDPSLSNIKDAELRNLILEMQKKLDPLSIMTQESGMFETDEE